MDGLISRIKNGQKVKFAETMAYVQENYHYRQVTFSNGLGKRKLVKQPGENEGSLKIFSLGKLLNLNQKETLALSDRLEKSGFLATAIRPPTVPRGQSRIRIALSADHTREQVEELIEVFRE